MVGLRCRDRRVWDDVFVVLALDSLRKSLMSSLVLVHLVAKPKNFNIKYNYAYLDLLSISSFLTVFFIFGYKNLPMSFLSLFRNPGTLGVLNTTTLLAPCGSTYLLRSHMVELSEDHEARMVWLSPHFKALLIMYALYQNKWKYPLRVWWVSMIPTQHVLYNIDFASKVWLAFSTASMACCSVGETSL